MPREHSAPSLAAWLLRYYPDARPGSLQHALDANLDLVIALEHLSDAVKRHETGADEQQQLERAQKKIHTLRFSLTHLTSHANSLTSRLVESESSLVSLRQQGTQTICQLEDERDGLRALCGVWQGRWREEKRMREEAEERLRSGMKDAARSLNGKGSRDETTLRVIKAVKPPARPPHTRRPSSSASSSSAESTHPHVHQKNAARRTSSSTLGLRHTIADLSSEMDRTRREADRLLAERDAEIARLEAEQRLRRDEMAQLYASLDTLLNLSHLPAPAQSPMSAAFPSSSKGHHPPAPLADPRTSASLSSVLDLPAIQAIAAHSRSRLQGRASKGGVAVEDMGDTLRLEQEIREMERTIRLLSDEENHSRSSIVPEDGPASNTIDSVKSKFNRDTLLRTIDELNDQVSRLQRELEEVTSERTVLRRLCDEQRVSSKQPGNTVREEAAEAYIQRLEADRARLSRLLASSESESHSLSQQLAATHSQIEDLSTRVRRKLEEQKAKLNAAYAEIERLANELEESERKVEEEGRVVEELGKELRATGDNVGRAVNVDLHGD
ncbi:hypothetical protein JCM21900_004736 [Sporobolomyces salmonicolor]